MRQQLIVSPGWLGDIVMAQALLIALKAEDPSTILDVVVPDYYAPIVCRMPEVRQAIALPITHGQLQIAQRYRIARQLRDRYQRAFILPNSFKSALIPFWAKIPKRVGWLGECRWGLLNDVRRLERQRYPRMVDRYIALAFDSTVTKLPHLVPKIPCDPSRQRALLSTWSPEPLKLRPVIALCPGAAFGPAKRWPVHYFGQLAQLCLQAGWAVWLLGSAAEQSLGQAIEQSGGMGCLNLIGQTNLTDMIDWLEMADVVVCNDSGLMHVAAAVQTAVVAIYGASGPAHTPPLISRYQLLVRGLSCQPCGQRMCRYDHYRCLTDIQPTQVWSAIKQQLVV